MKQIVISGYYGFGNAGDEAMLSAILEAMLEVIPNARITVISGDPERTKSFHGVHAIGRFDMGAIYSAIKQCDLLISGGGSLLQDVTSTRSLYYYLSIISLANWLGKKVMIYAQGIGPLHKSLARKTVGTVLNGVTMITVRDQTSKEELVRLGVDRVPIHVTADAVLSMHPVDLTIGKRLLKGYPLDGVNPKIGVSVRSWKSSTAYRQELARALDALVKEYEADVVFLPMQHPEDTREAQSIAAYMEHKPVVLEQSFTTTELLSLCGNMDMLIGIRLHALVFGALMGTPVVGITYDPKITNFLKMIGEVPVGELDTVTEADLLRRSRELLSLGTLPKETERLVETLRTESLQNAHIAIQLLQHDS